MVTLNTEEIDQMRADMASGKLSPTALRDYLDAEARAVFGHDARRRPDGSYIEQGFGAPGHETENHFAALLRAERDGIEPKGSYEKPSPHCGSVMQR